MGKGFLARISLLKKRAEGLDPRARLRVGLPDFLGLGRAFAGAERSTRTINAPTERNSLCQFWNDSNQKRLVADVLECATPAGPPCRSLLLAVLRGPAADVHGERRTDEEQNERDASASARRRASASPPRRTGQGASGSSGRRAGSAGPRASAPSSVLDSDEPAGSEDDRHAATNAAICRNSLSQFSADRLHKKLPLVQVGRRRVAGGAAVVSLVVVIRGEARDHLAAQEA